MVPNWFGPLEADDGADPLGRAMLAHFRDEPGRLIYRDGAERQDRWHLDQRLGQ